MLSHKHSAPFVTAASLPWPMHSPSLCVLTAGVPQGILHLHSHLGGSDPCYSHFPASDSWTRISGPAFSWTKGSTTSCLVDLGVHGDLNVSWSDALHSKSSPRRSLWLCRRPLHPSTSSDQTSPRLCVNLSRILVGSTCRNIKNLSTTHLPHHHHPALNTVLSALFLASSSCGLY